MNIESHVWEIVRDIVRLDGDVLKLYLDHEGIDINGLSDNELESVKYALKVALNDIIKEVKS